MNGRRKPYTELGISRVPCARCAEPSEFQWEVCANDNRWMGVCKECDIELNSMVLIFFGLRNQRALMNAYRCLRYGIAEEESDG